MVQASWTRPQEAVQATAQTIHTTRSSKAAFQIVGAFDRLFRGIQFHEFDGKVLYVYAADEYRAGEIEDTFALHIATIAGAILRREVPVVMVLPVKLKQERDVNLYSIMTNQEAIRALFRGVMDFSPPRL